MNAIESGYFRTDLTEVFYQNPTWCAAMLEKIPAGRFGALDDLIGATVFLCSDASRYVTGQLLCIATALRVMGERRLASVLRSPSWYVQGVSALHGPPNSVPLAERPVAVGRRLG